jgi:hypothetical protein
VEASYCRQIQGGIRNTNATETNWFNGLVWHQWEGRSLLKALQAQGQSYRLPTYPGISDEIYSAKVWGQFYYYYYSYELPFPQTVTISISTRWGECPQGKVDNILFG